MEAAPRMDTSRPSNLRLAAFALTAFGALVIGVGSILTWVTVGFANLGAISSASRGTDLRDGKITLACAVVTLILVLASRLVSDTARAVMAGIVVVVGALAVAVAGWFIRSAPTNYPPVDSEALVTRLAQGLGKSPDEIRTTLAGEIDKLGAFTHVGAGPLVALIGGLMVVVGGVLTVRWAARLSAAHVPADEADAGIGEDERTSQDPSLD
jgi:hypothetical protein